MATLPGQRAQFTWALNQYNVADDNDERVHFARRMAKYIRDAPTNGFTVEQVTQGQSYPADEVQKYLDDPTIGNETGVSEDQAIATLAQLVDTTGVKRSGAGSGSVYAYGYRCAPDRLKIGCTDGDTVQRIAAQVGTSTPDMPVLFLEIKTDSSRALERALHAILAYRGQKVSGGGAEWFKTSPEEIERLFDFLEQGRPLS
jgi:T5orf172 domain